ncbi:MAG: hypothetical protein A3B70_06870 [Deltaproteobacteria bacterium RIFCSPHIGHO2_02_FULL_40_11]|nr:MAG: hypothetical protein A3B70_06870 [Deltaproteobacteria bacterium RIFCSPHIGHO2_02_FULL_40_11]
MIVLQSLYAMPVADRYIVVFQDWVGRPDLNAQRLATQHGLGLGHIYRHALKGCVATVPFNKLDLVKNDPDVKYVSQDQGVTLVGNDRVSGPGKPGGGKGGTTQPAQVLPFGIHRVNTQFSSLALIDWQDQRVDVDVAVLDTGIDKSHPDLNVVGGVNFSTGRATNFKDGNGHGTHVSGTIGALDNAIGVVGVAPGARLWAVRVLDSNGSGFLSDVIAGIDWVTARFDVIDVANMSLGWTESSSGPSPVQEAIQASVAKGIVYAVAAGNDSKDAQSFAPASYPEVMTVSAMADSDGMSGGFGVPTSYGVDDTIATFSNFGSSVDLAAPGVDIFSTLPGGLYGKKSGTSMASPHVAGAAALYVVRFGKPFDGLGVEAVRQGLIQFGTPQNSLDGFSGDVDGFPEPLVNVQF